MTRRTIVFIDQKTGNWYATPEFNGDKEEFEWFKMGDACDASWNEILKIFDVVYTYTDFVKANVIAQSHYYSLIGESGSIWPVRQIRDITKIGHEVIVIGIPTLTYEQMVDLKDCQDSALLPSGSQIAYMYCGKFGLSLETTETVSLNIEGMSYNNPSEFPPELIERIRTGKANDRSDIHIHYNSSFKFVYLVDGEVIDSQKVNAENWTQKQVFEEMKKSLLYWIEQQ